VISKNGWPLKNLKKGLYDFLFSNFLNIRNSKSCPLLVSLRASKGTYLKERMDLRSLATIVGDWKVNKIGNKNFKGWFHRIVDLKDLYFHKIYYLKDRRGRYLPRTPPPQRGAYLSNSTCWGLGTERGGGPWKTPARLSLK
jgi:hypothetical protein